MAAHLLDQGRMVGTGMVSEPQRLASSQWMAAAKLSSDDIAIFCTLYDESDSLKFTVELDEEDSRL